MMRAAGLCYRIGDVPLVRDVNIELQPGKLLAVLGPNGAGKSTLLKMLAGQLQPTAGEITVNDRPLQTYAARDIAQWRGVLSQTSQVPFDFTANEIVLLGRSPHLQGVERNRDHEIARAALMATGTEHLAERVVGTLSGGELQRVHFARVLAQIWEPQGERVLLLDEPTSSLDLSHQHETLALARKFVTQGVAGFVILHDLNLAALYADTLLVLHNGCTAATGTPEEVLNPEIISQVFNIQATVINHPTLACPWVIPTPRNRSGDPGRQRV